MLKKEVFMKPIKPMKVLHSIPVLFYEKRDNEYETYWYRDVHKKCNLDIRYHNNISDFKDNYKIFQELLPEYLEDKQNESNIKVFVSIGGVHITLARINM